MQTILLAVTGLSPAIVTETVWALAAGKPRVVPSRVRAVTTRTGARVWEDQLFAKRPEWGGSSVWQALRNAVGAKPDELIAEEPRLIGEANDHTGVCDALDDILTPEHNALAAEFILDEVRRVAENPDCRLIASIAGGRKTMGALLHAAVSLVGREKDRITHVLVDPPYDTLRGFFFPGQPGPDLRTEGGRACKPRRASVYLADVPFVPLRNRFKDIGEMPGSFDRLRRKFSRELKRDASRPHRIEIDYRRKVLTVDAITIKASVKSLAILHCLLEAQQAGRAPATQAEAAACFTQWIKTAEFIPLGVRPGSNQAWSHTDIAHDLGELRIALRRAQSSWEIPKRSLVFPAFSLHPAANVCKGLNSNHSQ